MNTLGQRLKRLRTMLDLSQDKVSKDTNISRSNISKIESDTLSPTANAIIALAQYFFVSTDWLLTERGQGPFCGLQIFDVHSSFDSIFCTLLAYANEYFKSKKTNPDLVKILDERNVNELAIIFQIYIREDILEINLRDLLELYLINNEFDEEDYVPYTVRLAKIILSFIKEQSNTITYFEDDNKYLSDIENISMKNGFVIANVGTGKTQTLQLLLKKYPDMKIVIENGLENLLEDYVDKIKTSDDAEICSDKNVIYLAERLKSFLQNDIKDDTINMDQDRKQSNYNQPSNLYETDDNLDPSIKMIQDQFNADIVTERMVDEANQKYGEILGLLSSLPANQLDSIKDFIKYKIFSNKDTSNRDNFNNDEHAATEVKAV